MKLIILICLFILSSCDRTKIIYSKDYKTDKPCICNYSYTGLATIWFQDSCNKYNIGDTIK